MAWEANVEYLPGATAGANLSSDKHKFAKMGSGGVVKATSAGEVVDGVLQSAPDASGKVVQLAVGGAVKVLSGNSVAKGALVMPDANAKAITAAAAPTAATKTGGTGPYVMTPAMTVIVDVDNIGNATCTFDAAAGSVTDTTTYTGGTAATITDTTSYAVADQDTLTCIITQTDAVNGVTVTTVTFAQTTTTALQVAEGINDQTPHLSASVVGGQVKLTTDEVGVDCSISVAAGTGGLSWDTPVAGTGGFADQDGLTEKVTIDGGTEQTVTFSGITTEVAQIVAQMGAQLVDCKVAVVGGQAVITSDKQGTDSSVAIGTGTCALAWDTPVAGTGDVADILAVTSTEVKTVVEADSTAEVTVVGAGFTMNSPTTGLNSELDFTGGTGLTALGLSVETLVGSDSGTYFAGRAMEAAGGADELFTIFLNTGKN